MSDKKKGYTSEWRSISELRPVAQDLSDYGYKKEYIEAHKLDETKIFHWSNMITGVMNFFEPLEVKSEGGIIYYRVNENHVHMDEPEAFDTQFGRFNNHNHGEFVSWLGKPGYDGLPEKEQEINRLFGRDDFYIEGNYCDMFDCGDYCYAVSNLMHLGLGDFKIVRIDSNLEAVTIYDNAHEEGWTSFEYEGRFKNDEGFVVIVSGSTRSNQPQQENKYRKRTLLLKIDNSGNCNVVREWAFRISSPNSMVEVDGFVYFGQNKMITRLNMETGELSYFTNKNDEELAALVEHVW